MTHCELPEQCPPWASPRLWELFVQIASHRLDTVEYTHNSYSVMVSAPGNVRVTISSLLALTVDGSAADLPYALFVLKYFGTVITYHDPWEQPAYMYYVMPRALIQLNTLM